MCLYICVCIYIYMCMYINIYALMPQPNQSCEVSLTNKSKKLNSQSYTSHSIKTKHLNEYE